MDDGLHRQRLAGGLGRECELVVPAALLDRMVGRRVVADHLTADLTFASPDWSLEQAAAAMVRGSFRHLVVVEGGELAGILSMRDIVRCWTKDGASCEVPAA